MSQYESAFFVIPSRIMNLPNLTLSFLKIYETIFQFWNHGRDCYLSNLMIMKRTGINSESTIRKAFMFFEKHNELIRVYEGTNRYLKQPQKMVKIDPDGVEESTGGASIARRGGVDSATPTINKEFNNKKESAHLRKDAQNAQDEMFDEFWKIYPKKKDKKRAKEKFKKIPPEKILIILDKLKQQIEHESQWKDKKYIPEPSTYLNQERWEDEITPTEKTIENVSKRKELQRENNEIRSTVPWFGPDPLYS